MTPSKAGLRNSIESPKHVLPANSLARSGYFSMTSAFWRKFQSRKSRMLAIGGFSPLIESKTSGIDFPSYSRAGRGRQPVPRGLDLGARQSLEQKVGLSRARPGQTACLLRI